MSGLPGYDAWLAGGDPGEAAAQEWEAFEKWADLHRPDLDWDDDDALDAAKAEWDALVEQIEARAAAEEERLSRGCECRPEGPCEDDPAGAGCRACADQNEHDACIAIAVSR